MIRTDVEVRRLAIEIIATLVNIKSTMSELILKPAGIPPELYKPLFKRCDDITGKLLSKRKIAPLILDGIENRDDCDKIMHRMIEIAANWSNFHLAHDEFQARATVQKARELMGTIELMDAREAKIRELARKEELCLKEQEHAATFRKQSELLRMMFDELAVSKEPQKKGYLLQELLNRTFDLHAIPVFASFTRNEGGEQIDGAFAFDGGHYIVECRWRKEISDIRDLDGLLGQIARSGRQTMGVFLSINGWSDNVVPLLKQNPDKSIILMDGHDLRAVLAEEVDLRDFLIAKIAKLSLKAEPYYPVVKYRNEQTK